MISKSTAKFIKSLQLKKYRKQEHCFLVEGAKSVLEVLHSDFHIKQLIVTDQFLKAYPLPTEAPEILLTSPKELTSLGTLKTNDMAIAVVKMKEQNVIEINNEEWVIALDDINDPGNLGTIMRIADWYGINKIIASEQTADFYNPKVIAASKGSFCRVSISYTDLVPILTDAPVTTYGAMMEGANVHNEKFTGGGILIMGNEANGISPDIEALLNKKITIPRYGQTESLNVAMATAIICDNIMRNKS